MATKFSQALLMILSAYILNAPQAIADDFPGKGDRFAWGNALPYYNLANKYLEHGRYEDAIAKYEEAIFRYEYDADFFINYGVALRKCEHYTAAEQAFKKAIELRGNDWQAWSNLANSYLKQNRLKETIACFQKAMKMNPPPPKEERENMLKDIADINKILSMQAPPPAVSPSAAVKPTAPPAKQSATKASTLNKARTASSTKGAEGTTDNALEDGKSPSQSNASTQAPNKQELKKSGWDWVY
ncbi:MAG: tetratricopeptide repeat protein [Candidatus Obscuribacterales bacterium]|nr:tetratricopeptide repeat protein [Candidatus Obscuribacterales bacterium]